MTVTATSVTGRRHRVVAIGLGLGGMTAAKALKHDLVSITDALVFLMRMTAQGTSRVHHQTSLWLQVVPTTAAALATIGVLITLYVLCGAGRQGYEIATAADYFSCHGLWRSRRTPKGWC
jgi:hypothetical protein